MNERILELADKAIEDMPGAWNIPDEFCEKFAELIVAECTDLVQKYMSRWPEDHELTKQIKEHFGVE